MNILPYGMQFKEIKTTNEYTRVPEELIHAVKFIATEPATRNELFTITLSLYRLATGANTIATVAGDTAGNTATDVRSIILDDTAPVVAITAPVDNSITNQPNYLVTGTVDKPATVSIKLNNGALVWI